MKRGFTMLELILAVTLLGVMTTVTILTFRAVTNGWRVSREYVDKIERTDYAIDQLISGLKCAYYPHADSQSYEYGFALTDNGDGEKPRDSDIIEWTKKGPAIIGADSAGDGVHRIRVQVLEEGDRDFGEQIEKTGLYARVMPKAKVLAKDNGKWDADEFNFANDELYRPVLIATGVCGFNCRVLKEEPAGDTKNAKTEKSDYEDEFAESNSIPYKVQLTFYIEKEDDEFLSQSKKVPIVRVVRMPVHEQSKDGASLPNAQGGKSSSKKKGEGGK